MDNEDLFCLLKILVKKEKKKNKLDVTGNCQILTVFATNP